MYWVLHQEETPMGGESSCDQEAGIANKMLIVVMVTTATPKVSLEHNHTGNQMTDQKEQFVEPFFIPFQKICSFPVPSSFSATSQSLCQLDIRRKSPSFPKRKE